MFKYEKSFYRADIPSSYFKQQVKIIQVKRKKKKGRKEGRKEGKEGGRKPEKERREGRKEEASPFGPTVRTRPLWTTFWEMRYIPRGGCSHSSGFILRRRKKVSSNSLEAFLPVLPSPGS